MKTKRVSVKRASKLFTKTGTLKAHRPTEHSMFFRFYGATDAQIDECFKKMGLKGIVKTTKGPIDCSVNPFLPAGQNTQVTVYFDTAGSLAAAYSSKKAMRVYAQYAAPNINKKGSIKDVVARKPGDMAFGV